jgi:hypothetical protein
MTSTQCRTLGRRARRLPRPSHRSAAFAGGVRDASRRLRWLLLSSRPWPKPGAPRTRATEPLGDVAAGSFRLRRAGARLPRPVPSGHRPWYPMEELCRLGACRSAPRGASSFNHQTFRRRAGLLRPVRAEALPEAFSSFAPDHGASMGPPVASHEPKLARCRLRFHRTMEAVRRAVSASPCTRGCRFRSHAPVAPGPSRDPWCRDRFSSGDRSPFPMAASPPTSTATRRLEPLSSTPKRALVGHRPA